MLIGLIRDPRVALKACKELNCLEVLTFDWKCRLYFYVMNDQSKIEATNEIYLVSSCRSRSLSWSLYPVDYEGKGAKA